MRLSSPFFSCAAVRVWCAPILFILCGFFSLKAQDGLPPVLDADQRVDVRAQTHFSFHLAAEGPVQYYTAAPLPPGVVLDPESGEIAGTPVAAGQHLVRIGAVNENGASAPVDLTLRIYPATGEPADIRAPIPAIAYVDEVFSLTISVQGAHVGSAFKVKGLPNGFSHQWIPEKGLLLSGQPVEPGFHVLTVEGTNLYGKASVSFPLAVMERVWDRIQTDASHRLTSAAFGGGEFVIAGRRRAGSFGSIEPLILSSSDGGQSWNVRTPQSENRRFYSSAYGNGTFVAQGMDGIFYTSLDGKEWTRRHESLTGGQLSQLVFGNGFFARPHPASFSDIRFEVSENGIEWSNQDRPIDGAAKVGFGEGYFIALGSENRAARAIDPRGPWTDAYWPGSYDHTQSIAAGGGHFMVGGRQGRIWISSDGLAWERRPAVTGEDFRHLAYGQGRFIAVTENGKILSSIDGEAWTRQNAGVEVDILSSAAGDETFILAGEEGIVLRHTGTWVPGFLPQPSIGLILGEPASHAMPLAEDAEAEQFFGFGLPDGLSLDAESGVLEGIPQESGVHEIVMAALVGGRLTEPTPFRLEIVEPADARPPEIAHLLIAFEAGEFSDARLSADSALPVTDWQVKGLPEGVYLDVHLDGSGSYVADLRGRLSEPGVYPLQLIATNAAGSSEEPTYLIVPHRETEEWAMTHFDGEFLYSTAFGNERFVVLSDAGTFHVSPDGHSWTTVAHGREENPWWVRFTGGKFLAHFGYGEFLVSENGETWETWTVPGEPSLSDIVFGSGGYLAVGADGWMARSPDGEIWNTLQPITDRDLSRVSYGDGYYFFGDDRRAWSSNLVDEWMLVAPENIERAWSVVAGNGVFIAWNRFVLALSHDALNWSVHPAPETFDSGESAAWVHFANGAFILHSNRGNVHVSVDGHQWTRLTPSFPVHPSRVSASDNGQLVGSGSSPDALVALPADKTPLPVAPHLSPGQVGKPMETRVRSVFGQGTFFAVGLPPGLDLDQNTGEIHGVPTKAGEFEAGVGAVMEGRPSDPITMRFKIYPVEGDPPPIFEESVYLEAGQWRDLLVYLPIPFDPLGNYHVEGLPDGIRFDPYRGTLYGIPSVSGDFIVEVHRDHIHGMRTETLQLTIHAPDFNRTAAETDFFAWAIAAGPYRSAVVGHSGRILIIEDGDAVLIEPDPDNNTYDDIAYGDADFIAISGNRFARGGDAISDNWTTGSFGDSFSATSITFGNGRYVAAGRNGRFGSSTDGTSWTLVETDQTYEINRIRYGSDRFVAVGDDGLILTSTDGESWHKRTTPTGDDLQFVAYGAGRYLVGGANGTLLWSPDGEVWIENESPNPYLIDLDYAADQFVGASGSFLYTSEDGVHWVERSSEDSVNAVTWDPGSNRFLAVGSGQRVVSAKGEWEPFIPDVSFAGQVGQLFEVFLVAHYGPDRFNVESELPPGLALDPDTGVLSGTPSASGTFHFEISAENEIGVSEPREMEMHVFPAEGPEPEPNLVNTNWIVRTGEHFEFSLTVDHADGHTQFAAIELPEGLSLDAGTGKIEGAISDPGRYDVRVSVNNFFGETEIEFPVYVYDWHWERRELPVTADMNGIAYGNERFVAVGASGQVAVSSNGSDWSLESVSGNPNLEQVHFASDRFFAIAGSRIYATEDGSDWSMAYQSMFSITSFHWTGEQFVAIAFPHVLHSSDGQEWTTEIMSQFHQHTSRGLSYGNDIFVSMQSSENLAISEDGVEWEFHSAADFAISTRSLSFGNDYFLAAGRRWGALDRSINGLDWEQVFWMDQMPNPGDFPELRHMIFNHVHWTGNEFIATGNFSIVLHSSDGLNWREIWLSQSHGSQSRNFVGGATNGEIFVVLEQDAVQIASYDLPISITSEPQAYGIVGEALEYQIMTDRPVEAVTVEGLPPGLSVEGGSGLISGTPLETGSFEASVRTAGEETVSARFTLTFEIYPATGSPPRILGPTAIMAGAGRPLEHEVEIDGMDLSSTLAITGLPEGLSFDASTSVITGVPLEPGSYSVLVAFDNVYGERTREIDFYIEPARWEQLSSPVDRHLNAVTFSEGRYVAVGEGGTIVTSEDGLQWDEADSPLENDLYDIAFGGGYFRAVGEGGAVVESLDGVEWQAVSYTEKTLEGIAFGPDWSVMVGDGIQIRTKIDGGEPNVREGSQALVRQRNVTWGAHGFLSSGQGNLNRAENGLDWESSGGIEPPLTGWDIMGIAYSGERYHAILHREIEDRSRIISSSDGLTWRGLDFEGSGRMTGLSEGGQPVAVGSGGYILRSVFPEYWTEDYSGVTGNLRGATRSAGGYVAVGEEGIILYRTLSGPPELLSGGEASGQMGQAFSYSIMSDQSGHELSALRLPEGLELDPETARIHGTPIGHGKTEIVVEAANAFGRSILVVPVTIVGAAPVIVSLPSEINIHEGDPLEVPVEAYGIDDAQFRWFYGGNKITDSRFLGVSDGLLVLDEALLSDSGEYYVELQNTFGTTVSDPVRVTVVLSYDAWADAVGLDGDERAIERITRKGLPNLVAYALGLLPDGDIRGSGPMVRQEGDCVVLSFATARWAADARPVIEQSSDLDKWTLVQRPVKSAAADSFVETWTLEICEDAPSRFYRVRFEIE